MSTQEPNMLYLIELAKNLIHSESEPILRKLVEEVVPLYPIEQANAIRQGVIKMASASSNTKFQEYARELDTNTASACHNVLITAFTKNSLGNVEPDLLSRAIRGLGDMKAETLYSIISRPSSNFMPTAPERESLIKRILDECPNVEQKTNWQVQGGITTILLRYRINAKSAISNQTIKKLLSFATHIQSEVKRNEFEAIVTGHSQSGVDIRLQVEDLPILESGIMRRPEFLLAMLDDPMVVKRAPDFPIAYLTRRDEAATSPVRHSPDFSITPASLNTLLRKENNNISDDHFCFAFTKISFVDYPREDDRLASYLDDTLYHGISIPQGYAMEVARLSHLAKLPVAQPSAERMQRMMTMLDSFWATPRNTNKEQNNEAPMTFSADTLVRRLIQDESFREVFRQSRFCTPENVKAIANTMAFSAPSMNKPSQRLFYSNVNKLIASLYQHFGCLPDTSVFLTSKIDVERFHTAGIRFSDTFCLMSGHTKSMLADFDQDTYNKIADMNAVIGINDDIPSNPNEALAMAMRRSSQPMYTALLRRFDYDVLEKLALKPKAVDCLILAFPERKMELLSRASATTKRMFLQDDLVL